MRKINAIWVYYTNGHQHSDESLPKAKYRSNQPLCITSRSLIIFECFSSFNNEISRIQVDGTPSESLENSNNFKFIKSKKIKKINKFEAQKRKKRKNY